MNSRFTTAASSSILAAVLALSLPASAQTQGDPLQDEPAAQEKSLTPSAASLAANHRVEDPNLPVRIATELLGGFIGYGAGAVGVSLLVYAVLVSSHLDSPSAVAFVGVFGGLVGSVLAPLCVWATGSLWQAKGQLGQAFIGGLIGTAIEAGCLLLLTGLAAVNPMAGVALAFLGYIVLMAPAVGAVIGYEMSHAKALQGAVPVAVPLRLKDGGGIALAWAI